MNIVKPSIEFLNMTEKPLQAIEKAGRVCYKSEDQITEKSSIEFIEKIIKRGHLAVIEHATASYKVVCDRGVTHEIVRHRLFSYCQESTRYCNYSKEKFGNEISVIMPEISGKDIAEDKKMHGGAYEELQEVWYETVKECEKTYMCLIENGISPQIARSILPNALKTEIVITGNLREWLHFFDLRCAPAAHPQMREIANMILEDIKTRIPIIFDNIKYN